MKRALGRAVIMIVIWNGVFGLVGCGGSGEAVIAAAPTPPPPAPQPPPPPTTYSATVSWSVPLLNTDGTPLADISGYRVYYGTDSSDLAQSILVSGVGNTSHVVSDLPQGTYYFAVATLNSMGVVSDPSNAASMTIP